MIIPVMSLSDNLKHICKALTDIIPEAVEAKPEDLGRGKRNRVASRLYTKDWEYTDDRDVQWLRKLMSPHVTY